MKIRKIRKVVSTLLAIAIILAMGSCGVPAPADPVPAAQPSKSTQDPLTKVQAEAIALNHAGLTAAQVKGLRSQFDIDDGVKEWDVEFWCDGWEYDYEIHAVSGAIRSFDKERD